MASRTLVIVGAHGHGRSVAEAALSAGFVLECFIDEIARPAFSETLLGFPVLSSIHDVSSLEDRLFALAVGSNHDRRRIYERLTQLIRDDQFPSVIHQTASISRFASIGMGAQILQNASVGSSARVGNFSIVNTNAALDHDASISDFSRLNPGVVVGGGASIGSMTTIGMNASVADKVTIGDECIVGANSFVRVDLPSHVIAHGTPADIRNSQTQRE